MKIKIYKVTVYKKLSTRHCFFEVVFLGTLFRKRLLGMLGEKGPGIN